MAHKYLGTSGCFRFIFAVCFICTVANFSQSVLADSPSSPTQTSSSSFDMNTAPSDIAQPQTHVKAVGGRGVGSPSVSVGTPNALGDGNAIFSFIGYVNNFTSSGNSSTGSTGVGASFGNSHKYVGVTLSANSSSNLGFGLRVNHYFAEHTAAAIGAGNIGNFGPTQSKNFYFAATQELPFFQRFPISINAGFGTGSFYSITDAQLAKDNNIGGFGGIGITIYPNLSLIADYAARQYNIGTNYNFTLLKKLPMFFSLACTNINTYGSLPAVLQASLGFSVPLQ